MFAPEIIKQKDDRKENEKKEEEIIGKRSRPGSSCSLGSDIFFEEWEATDICFTADFVIQGLFESFKCNKTAKALNTDDIKLC